jgi:hypothetical protein
MSAEPTPIRDTGLMELGSLWQRTVSRHRPVEQWTTTDVAKHLHRLYGPYSTTSTDELSLWALQNNIDGQVLTTLLYTFDKLVHHNSKLCHPAESGGLGLSIQAVNWIQEDVQGFTRTNGFVHYSAFAPRSRRLEAHHTVQIQIRRLRPRGRRDCQVWVQRPLHRSTPPLVFSHLGQERPAHWLAQFCSAQREMHRHRY